MDRRDRGRSANPVLDLLSITEFKRCYLLRVYQASLTPLPQILDLLSSLEGPTGQISKHELNLYGIGLTDEALRPVLFALQNDEYFRKVDLRSNRLESIGKDIAGMLELNRTVECIMLSANYLSETSILELKKFHSRVQIDGSGAGQSGLIRKYQSQRVQEKYSTENNESHSSKPTLSSPLNGTNRILAMIKSKMGSGPNGVQNSSTLSGQGMTLLGSQPDSTANGQLKPNHSSSTRLGPMNQPGNQKMPTAPTKQQGILPSQPSGSGVHTEHLSFLYNTQTMSKQTANKHMRSIKTECSTASQAKYNHSSVDEPHAALAQHDSVTLERRDISNPSGQNHRMMSRINWLINLRSIFDKLKGVEGVVLKGPFLTQLKNMSASSLLVGAQEYRSSKSEVGLSLASIEKRILNISRNELTEDLLIGAVMQNTKETGISKHKEQEAEDCEPGVPVQKVLHLRTSSSESSKHNYLLEDSKRQVSTLYYEENSESSKKITDNQAELRRRLKVDESPPRDLLIGDKIMKRSEHNSVGQTGSSSNRYFEKRRSSSKSDFETARFNKVDGMMSSRNYENSSRPMSSRRGRAGSKPSDLRTQLMAPHQNSLHRDCTPESIEKPSTVPDPYGAVMNQELGKFINQRALKTTQAQKQETRIQNEKVRGINQHQSDAPAYKVRSTSPKEVAHQQTIKSTSGANLGLLGTFSTIRPTEMFDMINTSTTKQQSNLLKDLGSSQRIGHAPHLISSDLAKKASLLNPHNTGGPESFEFTNVESRNTSLHKTNPSSQLYIKHQRGRENPSRQLPAETESDSHSVEGLSRQSQRLPYEIFGADHKSSMIDHEARLRNGSAGDKDTVTHHSSKVQSISKDSQEKGQPSSLPRKGSPPVHWVQKSEREHDSMNVRNHHSKDSKSGKAAENVEEGKRIPSRHNSKKSVKSHESGGTSKVSKSKERTKKVIQVITSLLESLNRPFENHQANAQEKSLLEALNSLHIFEFKNVCVLGLDIKNCGDLNQIVDGRLLSSPSFKELILQIGILRIMNTPVTSKIIQTISHSNIILLSLNKCNLTSLNCLSPFESLNLLNVNDNQLRSLAGLNRCQTLNELYANNNQISTLQDLKHLKQLRILSLSSNSISEASEFQYLRRAGTGVQWLRVTNNPVCSSPGFQTTLSNILPKAKLFTQAFQEQAQGDLMLLENASDFKDFLILWRTPFDVLQYSKPNFTNSSRGARAGSPPIDKIKAQPVGNVQSSKHSTKKHGHTSSYHVYAPTSRAPDSSRVGGSGSRSARRLKSSSKRKRERQHSGVPEENLENYGLPTGTQVGRGLGSGSNQLSGNGLLHDTPTSLLKKSSSTQLKTGVRTDGAQSLLKARINQFVTGGSIVAKQGQASHKQSYSSGLLQAGPRSVYKPSASKKTAEKSTASKDKTTPRQLSGKVGHAAYRKLEF